MYVALRPGRETGAAGVHLSVHIPNDRKTLFYGDMAGVAFPDASRNQTPKSLDNECSINSRCKLGVL